MLTTIQAVVREGKIELLEPFELDEGIHLLVTVLAQRDSSIPDHDFWQSASHSSLERIWGNEGDDVYGLP